MFVDESEKLVASAGKRSGDEREQDDTERVDIGPRICTSAAQTSGAMNSGVPRIWRDLPPDACRCRASRRDQSP